MVLARWSAMILALPTVTAFGVVSTACVWSSSEMLSVLPVEVLEVLEVLAIVPVAGLAAVATVVRRGCVGLAPGAAPSAAP